MTVRKSRITEKINPLLLIGTLYEEKDIHLNILYSIENISLCICLLKKYESCKIKYNTFIYLLFNFNFI